jgi:[ribosomal protein S5]-alanine N-acetyltransferase
MRIVLESVVLRRPEERDVDQLYEFRNDWSVAESLVGFSTGYSRRDLVEWVERHRTQRNEVLWAIAERENDRCIGHVGLYNVDHRVRKADFGILIGDTAWHGRGVGTSVSSAVMDYAFRQLNLHRVQLFVLEDNSRARHLYEKLGFRMEGTLRDDQFRNGSFCASICMGILDDEWRRTVERQGDAW